MLNRLKLKMIGKLNNLFVFFLASYMIILTIPIAIGSIVYVKSVKVANELTEDYNKSLLEQARQVIDGYLHSVDQLAVNMELDMDITNALQVKNTISNYDMEKLIKVRDRVIKYKSVYGFIDDIYVYFKNCDSIITPTGKFAPAIYYQNINPYTKWSYEEWKNLLIQIHNKSYFPVQNMKVNANNKQVITYFQTMPLGENRHSMGTLVILIDIEQMKGLLKSINIFDSRLIGIFDENSRMIASIGDESLASPDILKTAEEEKNAPFKQIGSRKVIVSQISSGYNQWKYISVIPTDRFMQKVNYIKSLMIVVVSTVIALGFFLSYLFARRSYLPIKRIMSKLGSIFGNKPVSIKNELEFIEEVAFEAISENAVIKKSVKQQEPIMQWNILTHLIKGNINNSMQTNYEALKALGISFSYNWFCVSTIHIDSYTDFVKDDSLERCTLIKFIITNVAEELARKDYIAYTVDIDLDDIAIIFNFEDGNLSNLKGIYDIAYKAKEFVDEKFSIRLSIGIGDVHHGIGSISASYQESMKAMEYKILKGQGSIIAFEDIRSSDQRYTYPNIAETQLLNYIKAGDTAKVQLLLDELFTNYFRNNKISIDIARCLFFEIINMALKILNSVDIDYELVFESDFQPVIRILSCETVDAMYDTLKIIYIRICKYINKSKKSHNDDLKDKIVSYINQKFSDNSLSLVSIADAFHLNSSYLSYFFKEQMGENFLDYLGKVRIEMAKELLKNTVQPLSDIATQVGYADRGSLTRIFKKLEGVTPSQYREFNQA